MSQPANLFGGYVWRRGAQLGLWWLAAFAAVTIVLYVLLGLIGWSGVARALCAMFVGPVLALAGIVVWWVVRRPELVPADSAQDAGAQGKSGPSAPDD